MQCQSCNRDIPDDAALCPYCGQTVSSEEPPPPSAPPAPSRTTGRIWVLIVAVAAVAIAACLVCFICGVIGTSTPEYKATATARAVARRTEAARPSDTPMPPPTPFPTDTPSSVTYADIEYNYGTLTDIQWASYEQGLRGTRVRWVGEVEEVKGDLTTYLDVGQGAFHYCYLDGLSLDEARSLSKGDTIEFDATIRKVDRFLGLSVYLDDPVLISRS
ncbi:MAG: zinc-ribbon domain-containing protein [Anaerolineae bacterium]|nr:zinc-ribbon domain-containing protein [Anaerolineae bacterium]NIN96353.1 zinc-ribbon domain-containing protein [Anaerolineae bacterium]NIQ79388.1 zinc-ribbon domain-containing protein [Anaerolineae bacterium]